MEGGSWIVETRLLRKKSLTDDTDCLVREEGVCVCVCVSWRRVALETKPVLFLKSR